MQSAPIPPNESERLAALSRYDILDTAVEEEFDDFTRLASQICGTPISTITFVDTERQWFKSKIGLEASETPWEISFCGDVVAHPEILEVPDALEDERFRDNPFVTGDPNVRFYAGAPLVTPDGQNIGALCVLDRTPRHLTPEQREMLTVLSHQVVHLLELRLAGRRIQWLNENLDQLVATRTEELRESEERFRLFVGAVEDYALLMLDPQGCVISWNAGAERIKGYKPDEIIGQHFSRFYLPEAIEKHHPDEELRIAAKEGRHAEEGWRVRKDGSRFLADVVITAIHDDTGTLRGFAKVTRDITERKLAEMRLQEQASLLDQTQDAMYVRDLERRIIYWNRGAERLYGWTTKEVMGTRSGELFSATGSAHYFEEVEGAIMEKGSWIGEEEQVSKSGKKLIVNSRRIMLHDEQGKPKSVLATSTDITGLKKIQSQMLRTQRLESIGTLAGGIAHDLNNSLAPILMVTGLLRMQYPDASEMIDTVESSAKRGANMVRQLLTFAKGVEGERLLVDPGRLLKEIAQIIEGTFPKNIQLRTVYAKQLYPVLGDATQLHQVLLNLCVNARDAMPTGGTLSLEAENAEIDATYASAVPDAKPGRYLAWRVKDTGTGIPPEILEHIFEPFFSTKGPDKGTGLGLSTVIGIVKSHGGFVQIYSVPGQGSTFAIYLPADVSSADDTAVLPKVETTFRGHGETILVVDDEANVRQAARAVLTSLNFKVITAENGVEALVQVAEKRTELRAIITDLHMPKMDGLTFVRVLKSRLPEAGIIVASGRMEEREASEFTALGVSALLEKPFTQEKLEEALKILFPK